MHWQAVTVQERVGKKVLTDKFHICTRYIVLTRRERFGGREVGHAMPVEAVPLLDGVAEWEHMRPRSHFLCEQWRNHANDALLDDERFPLGAQSYRLEQDLLIDHATTCRAADIQERSRVQWVQAYERPATPPKQTLLPMASPGIDRADYVLRATA